MVTEYSESKPCLPDLRASGRMTQSDKVKIVSYCEEASAEQIQAVLERYTMTREELNHLMKNHQKHGKKGLLTTRLVHNRRKSRSEKIYNS